MIRIGVLDDSVTDRENLKGHLETFFASNHITIKIIEFSDPISFVEKYEAKYDLIFFDVEMPKLNGIEAARKIRSMDDKVKIVFVTNYPQFAIDGYGINALDYILKPVVYDQLALKLDRIIPDMKKDKEEDAILSINVNNKIEIIEINQITYVEVFGHYLSLHLLDGSVVEYRKPLSVLEKDLEPYGFFRCNSCYLVNIHYITKIKDNEVYIKDTALKISRNKKKAFMIQVTKYLSRGIT